MILNLRVGITYNIDKHLSIYPEDKEFILGQIGVPKTKFNEKLDNIF